MPNSNATIVTNATASIDSAHGKHLKQSERSRAMFNAASIILFTAAIFSSATLLFVVQPMVGKILLPKLGGAPAVWNICMLFFQGTLLAGYLSAHLLTKFVPLRFQVAIFAAALLLAMQSLPLSVGPEWVDRLLNGSATPSVWLLSVLLWQVAPVFFVLSTTSPLMQKWFARSGHPHASDPYFLYAASNVGSILALLAYPFVIEVNWGVNQQTVSWMTGFGFFTVLATCCGIASWYGHRLPNLSLSNNQADSKSAASQREAESLTWQRRAFWVLLAFIPSSLMLGVTTYLSTDVSSIPLIWVIPLTMYLLTFVVAFSNRQIVSAYWMGRIGALLILVIMVTVVTGANDPPMVIVPMHLLMFFAVAMLCHQRLADDRPSAEHLTDFYLWLSVGGVLGGLFNGLLAPSLFVTIIEYPLIMVLASYVRVTQNSAESSQNEGSVDRCCFVDRSVIGFGTLIFVMVLSLGWLAKMAPDAWIAWLESALPLADSQIRTLLAFGLPAALVMHNMERRSNFTMGLAALLLVSVVSLYTNKNSLERSRNFYGTIATATQQLAGGKVVKMFHGNTEHGWQWADAARRGIPLTYYGESSGVGKLIASRQRSSKPLNVGAIGLGAGTLAATMRAGDRMCYYEINPQVLDHAQRHFTYLDDARDRGADIEVRLGDARLVLEDEWRREKRGAFDVLVVDAFSSDSIPVHLITSECLRVYLQHTKADGVIAFHITNRFLNLEPVLAALARENELFGCSFHFRDIEDGHAFDEKTGETASSWVLISRDRSHLQRLLDDEDSRALTASPRQRLWTDDYSNVISAFVTRF